MDMKQVQLLGTVLAAGMLLVTAVGSARGQARSRESFNDGWRFARFGTMPGGSNRPEPDGMERVAFDDAAWRELNLPHDWGIEGPFDQKLAGRTGKLPWAGIGWYRKTFSVPTADRGKRIFLDIDGAMSDSTVWVNGVKAGGWPYGYNSYRVELTDHVKAGAKNVVAIRLDNKPVSSRWYPGGGIYRNTWLVKTGPVHVGHWGVYVTTPKVTAGRATVAVAVTIDNQSASEADVTLNHEIRFLGKGGRGKPQLAVSGPGGKLTVEAGGSGVVKATLPVSGPALWDLETPNLYEVLTTVKQGDKVVDTYRTEFGIRSIAYHATKGFLLNGKPVRFNGVCNHHDLGPLGGAVNVRAIARQIELLQEMGCNAIRTSHNMPAPELLTLCDRMGMVVQDEAFDCWKTGKTTNDYSRFYKEWHERDLVNFIHRDRNHPCVVMWSTGNEVREQGKKADHRISQRLTDIFHREDPTRPVSVGCNNVRAGFNGFQKTMDVFGYNYKGPNGGYRKFHNANPRIPLYGSETASCVSSRGEYFFPVSFNKAMGQGGRFHVSSYDLYAPPWAYRPDVEFVEQDKCPYVLGEFVWTGFDYLGEPTPYNLDKTNLLNFTNPKDRARMKAQMAKMGKLAIPSRSSYFGILDLCGFKKDRFYIYQARWRPDLPMVHILPHWNWPERKGEVTPVHVYTSGDEVELFLNGKSLGRKKKGRFEYRLRWDDVVYAPGQLRAVAYKKGKPWAKATMKTTGAVAGLQLTADRATITADGQDLSFVTAKVVDKDGLTVPRSHNSVQFSISGPGEIVATGNGDQTSHESFQATHRKVFNGLALVIVRAKPGQSGKITLTAKSDGLKSGSVTITAK